MSIKITIDDSDFAKVLKRLQSEIDSIGKRSLMQMADALLTLSRLEVPHDTGRLQSTGNAFWDGDSSAVAYDTIYAAFVHEGMRADGTHVIKHYQKGRKKKYLEDPLKLNLSKWLEIAEQELANSLK